jgi:hypothetical protein
VNPQFERDEAAVDILGVGFQKNVPELKREDTFEYQGRPG